MKKLWKMFDFSLISFPATLVLCTVMLFYERNVAVVGYALTVLLFAGKLVYQKMRREKLILKIKAVSDELDFNQGQAFEKLGVGCCVVEEDGTVIWANGSFIENFGISKKTKESNIKQIIKKDSIDALLWAKGYCVRVGKKYYSVYSGEFPLEDEKVFLLYFFDETSLRLTEKEFFASRPSIMHTVIDNADELYQNFKDSDCTSIFSRAEQLIEEWASSFGALCRKFSNARMMIFAQERTLQKMMEDKFSILDKIRDFTYEGKETEITLSIGVGKSDDLNEANDSARQALDMAQSRGGDQVAIKKDTEYKFYGGVSAGFEKKTTVRTRLIAKTMAEIIADSDNVLIMGHRFSDFDSLGSCIGMLGVASHFSKTAHIVINEKNTLAGPLLEKLKDAKGKNCIYSPEEALKSVTENTLLIITDTHKKSFTESPELCDKVQKITVIDHHRKSVGFIEDTVMFYHMPTSSSASEMVTEICQYVDKNPVLDKFTATALLSGIMLDTRNFILRTGVRTFQAAAYLRQRGANTVECKKLFSSDMDLFRQRNAVIDMATEYRGCALSKTENEIKGIRLATSQAADEMLNIEGVTASFVIFKCGDGVNISARSYGEVNVQLIMEALGGGGHQTMSACQLKDISVFEAETELKKAIDSYFDSLG